MFKTLGILTALFVSTSVLASAQVKPKFQRFSIEDGLSQMSVLDMVQDDLGYLWIATQDGLNRYNGYEFEVFLPKKTDDHTSVSGAYISCLLHDSEGILWFGIFGGGINTYDYRTGKFNYFGESEGYPGSFVSSIKEDSVGRIVLGTREAGLGFYDKRSRKFTYYKITDNPTNPKTSNWVTEVVELKPGFFLASSKADGLYTLDMNSASPALKKATELSLPSENIKTMIVDSSEQIWIGTDKGLCKLSNLKDDPVCYNNAVDDPSSISNDEIKRLYEDSYKNLWVGTKYGLNLYNRQDDSWFRVMKNPADPSSISCDTTMSFYEDKGKILWIGTYTGGLNKLNSNAMRIQHFFHDPKDPNSVSDNVIWGFFEEKGGDIWVATQNGVSRYIRNENRFQNFVHDPHDPTTISSNDITAIAGDSEGRIWISTLDKGLNRYDPTTKEIKRYNTSLGNLPFDRLSSLMFHSDDVLWIGTNGYGILRFDIAQEKVLDHFSTNKDDKSYVASQYIYRMIVDSQGVIWIGSEEGLIRHNKEDNTFTTFLHNPEDESSLSDDTVDYLIEGSQGFLWLATNKGLNRFDRKTGKVQRFDDKYSFAINNTNGVLEDDSQNIWISGTKGLIKYNPKTGEENRFSTQDGLQSMEFNGSVAYKTSRGELLFGGVNGFNIIAPDELVYNQHVPEVHITNFRKFNKDVDFGKPLSQVDKILLKYEENFISFEFEGLDFYSPERNRHRYMLEGFDKTWVDSGTRRFAGYTNLEPGNYTFRVIASNNERLWNDKGASIEIEIVPPFWKTLWFRIVAVLAVIGLSISIPIIRLKRIKKLNIVLEKKVEERTNELRVANQKIVELEKERTEKLMAGGFAHEIRNSLTGAKIFIYKILRPKDDSKDSTFMINGTHLKNIFVHLKEKLSKDDLRPVVPIIKEINANEEKMENLLKKTATSIERSLNIAGEIMNYSTLGQQERGDEEICVSSLMTDILEQHTETFTEEKIEVIKDISDDFCLQGKQEHFHTIFGNLIANAKDALSESKKPGKKTLEILAESTKNGLKIAFKDNAEGISEENMNRILDPFYSTKPLTGTGLGLGTVMKTVKLYDGTFTFESTLGEGSVFYVFFPDKVNSGENS